MAPDQVEHVVMGQVLQAGQGQIPSRQAQIKGGIPKEVSSETVNKVCASGIRSVGHRSTRPCAPATSTSAVAGGMESMSKRALPAQGGALRLPHGRRQGARRDDPRRPDQPVHAASSMGAEADEVGEELEMTRADMDKFALR